MKNCSRVVTFLGAALLAATMVGPALAAPKPPPPTGDFVEVVPLVVELGVVRASSDC